MVLDQAALLVLEGGDLRLVDGQQTLNDLVGVQAAGQTGEQNAVGVEARGPDRG
jgi:hypothetical protein